MKKLLQSLFVLMFVAGTVMAQERTITGTVTDKEDGKPLPGVTVRIKGTNGGTQTGGNGKYAINVPASATTLDFSYLGYVSDSKSIGSANVIDVALKSDPKSLSEVVVTAVGIEKSKASLGYSAAVLKTKDLTETNQTNLLNGLSGKVSGMQIGKSSGGLNSSVRVTLRGQRSLASDNQPLFVIDGVPVDNSSVLPVSGLQNTVDVGNRIGDLNPDDIETLTVLKGANAAALYGSRASNGAIIITTKSGKNANRNKKYEVSFTSSFSMESAQKLPELQNEFGSGYETATGSGVFVYDPIENTNWGPRLDGSIVPSGPELADGSQNMIPFSAVKNNTKDFFQRGHNILNSVSLSGGDDKAAFYASFSDNEAKGIIPMDKFRRNTVKLNGSAKLANHFNVAGNLSYNKNLTNTAFQGQGAASSVYEAVMSVSRQIDLKKYKDWRNNPYATPNGFFDGYYANPYYALENNRFNSNLDRILGSMQVGFDPYKWLNVTYRLGTDISNDNRQMNYEKTTYTTAYQRPANTSGGVTQVNLYRRIINSDLLVTFKKDFDTDWTTSLTLLNNVRQDDNSTLSASANALANPGFFNFTNRVGELDGSYVSNKSRIIGFAGDLNIGYKNYLFLNATGRYDISSTLPKKNNSYFYPSANLSYILSESINALKESEVLSYAKLRAGVSRVGSTAAPYSLEAIYAPAAGFPYGALPAFTLSNVLPNGDLKPEFTTSYELGTELSFLKDKIGLDFTYFQTKTINQIVSLAVPGSTGFTSATVNAGDISNKGIEVTLRGQPFKNPDGFSWNFAFNYTHINSSVKSLYGDSKEFPLGSGDPVGTAIVGSAFPVLKGTAYMRDPQGRVVVGTDGYIRKAADLKVLGKVNPDHILGFTNSFSYKAFSLTSTFEYRTGNVISSGTKSNLTFTGSTLQTAQYGREKFIYPNSVIETSPGVFTPNTTVATKSGSFDFWQGNYNTFAESNIIDAAFLKLREINLTFAMPKRLLEKTPFGKVNVAAYGSNILLWTPSSNKYIDPEANVFGAGNSQGREYMNTPSTRSFGLSLSATF